eukprot:6212913-Pleurochrysis_carterae.AAC.4
MDKHFNKTAEHPWKGSQHTQRVLKAPGPSNGWERDAASPADASTASTGRQSRTACTGQINGKYHLDTHQAVSWGHTVQFGSCAHAMKPCWNRCCLPSKSPVMAWPRVQECA